MPLSQNVQRVTLGQILNGDLSLESFETGDFTGDNRCIFARMVELYMREEKVNRINVANELMRWNELEKCGGLTYLVEISGS